VDDEAFIVADVVVVSAFVVAAVVDNVSALLNLRASSAIAVTQIFLVMAVCYLCHHEFMRAFRDCYPLMWRGYRWRRRD
jgi:cbb3-type cytochrome oxidase cytochrome c subunit